MSSGKFADGCHHWGWLISLIFNLILFAYFVGGMRSDMESIADRLTRVERVMDATQANATATANAAAATANAAATEANRRR